MAIIRSVRIGVSKTVNLGNFNSIRTEAEVTAEIPEGETIESATASLQQSLRELWEATSRAQKKGESVQ